MEIPLIDLRRLAVILFDHLEAKGVSSIRIDEDYYQDIPSPDRYHPTLDPPKIEAGQLTDDWAELEKVLGRPEEPISYALVWYAAILRRIGEILVD